MNLFRLFALTITGALFFQAQAVAYMIDDHHAGANTYWGSDDHGWGDVIGDKNKFDILGMDVYRNGNSLTVDIFTNFAGRGDDREFHTLTRTSASGYDGSDPATSKGIGYGDLFLASSWNPEGSDAHNSLDDHATGTLWEYGIAIDNRWWDGTSAGGGSAILYKLTGGSNNANALLSEDFLSGGTYRNGQEIAVDTSLDHDIVDANASWSIDAANKKISFMFDIGGTGLLDNGELALHWAMTCGNDTIEGSYDVPEPGSLSLISLSLLMAGLATRRKRMS